MYRRWFCLLGCLALAAVGCRGTSGRGGLGADPCPPDVTCTTDGPCPDAGPACPPAPCGKGEEVHVHVPRQRVAMPHRQTAAVQQTQQEQIVQTRQVMLVPQQVLVPFVQTSVTGPVRVNGLSETQVTNLATTTTTGVGGGANLVVTGQGNAAGGGANAASGNPNAAGGNPNAPNPQSLSECLTQLRLYEEQVRRLTATAESLEAEVKKLRANPPPATPPTPLVVPTDPTQPRVMPPALAPTTPGK